MAKLNLIGDVYGKLTIIRHIHNSGKGLLECKCSCGNICTKRLDHLRSGSTSSCGCLSKTANGLSKTKEYKTWSKMKYRCSGDDPHHKKYYTDFGIKVCERWINSFENFLEDMGLSPSPKHSIDRKDGKLGYSPENCRWATKEEQMHNIKSNKWHTIKGETLILKDWCKKLGLGYCHTSADIKKLGITLEEYINHKGLNLNTLLTFESLKPTQI